jgi:hypothetical protein
MSGMIEKYEKIDCGMIIIDGLKLRRLRRNLVE